MYDCVDDNTKQGVRHRRVPGIRPGHADAYDGQKNCSSDPFNDVINGKHQEWEVENVAWFVHTVICLGITSSFYDAFAQILSVFVRVEIDNGYAAYEL